MALTFTQTDDVASCPVMAACAPAGGTISSQASDFAMRVGGTAGTVAESFDIPAGSSRYGVFFQSGATDQTDWPSGNWTVNLNVSTAQNNTAWTGVWVCRIDDACGTVASVGSETTSTDISAGGVFSKTVTGAATTGAATDRVYVVCEFTNSHNMTARTVGVTPSETVASPIPEPESVTVSTGNATDVTATSATLNGTLDEFSVATSADVWFEWRAVGATTWNSTPVQNRTATGAFSAPISGLTSTTDYEFRAQASTTNASSTGATNTFVTQSGDFFDVAITGSNSPVVAGEPLTVNYTVTNTGTEAGTQDVELFAEQRAPARTETLIDDFEWGGPITDRYAGATGSYVIDQNAPIYEGLYSLKRPSGTTWVGVYSNPGGGLPYYPGRGDIIWHHLQQTATGRSIFHFGSTGGDPNAGDCYGFELRSDTNASRIFRRDAGTTTTLDSVSYAFQTGQWYQVRLGFGAEGDDLIEATVFTDAGEQVLYLSATDATYNGTGLGVHTNTTAAYDRITADVIQ